MCFNASASITTFLMSFGLSSYLIFLGIKQNNKSDIFNSFIGYLIGFMQLLEYFVWKNQNNFKNNHILTLLINFLLYLQPVIMSLLYIFLFVRNTTIKLIIWLLVFLYSIYQYYLLNYLNKYTLTTKPSKKSCRLEWGVDKFFDLNQKNKILGNIFYGFYYGIIFFIFLISFFLNTKLKNSFGIVFLVITWILAHLYSNIKQEKNNKNYIFGSVWCFLAVAYPLVIILSK